MIAVNKETAPDHDGAA